MSSEDVGQPGAEHAPGPAAPQAVPGEKPLEPGEEWIEEYESEKRQKRPRKRPSHLLGAVIAVAVVLALVFWTLLSPQVLPVAGVTYLESAEYANLGSYAGDLDIWWFFDLVHVADTTWGVSVSGERNVSSGQPANFRVLVTKVGEDTKNPWFVGTSVDLEKVDLFLEDGTRVGSMASQSSEPFGPLAQVVADFGPPGEYECYVYVEVTVYCKMVVGYLPVKVLRMNVDLDVDVIVS